MGKKTSGVRKLGSHILLNTALFGLRALEFAFISTYLSKIDMTVSYPLEFAVSVYHKNTTVQSDKVRRRIPGQAVAS